MKTLCIYHGNCMDGFTAAWVVRKYFGEANVEFYSGVYGKTPPDVTGRSVIFVDFCYQRPVMLELAEKAGHILIIDHHATAKENMVDMPDNVSSVFNMDHSGAMLAWLYFFGSMEIPEAIKYVEDRDLWKFKYPNTREICANIFSYPYDFKVWDSLMLLPPEEFIEGGVAIERKHFKDIEELLAKCTRTMVIGGYDVPVANIPYTLSSDAASILAKNGIPGLFGACYYDSTDGRVFSLRSIDGGMNVAKIAQKYGGGGHEHASGFEVPLGWEGDA